MAGQINYIVFLCYGNERVIHECTYALLSLSRLYPGAALTNTEIWIYTDNPGWFRSFKDCPLPLHYREVDSATIKQWRGKIDFVHRVKIEALRDFTRDKTGNILYVDTDIVFTHTIDTMLQYIGAGRLYMHMMEGVVSDEPNLLIRKLNRHLQKNTQKSAVKDLHHMAMWNAGVLGFNTQYKYLLDEVLVFTDSEYPGFPKHIVEQFAFSVYFQQAGVVRAASPYIFHYWKLKEASDVFASFFSFFKNKSWEELTRCSVLIQVHALMQAKVNFYHTRGAIGTILDKPWLPPKQNWAELLKQL